MTHKEFLIEFPLQLGVNKKNIIAARNVLSKANETYPIQYHEEKISETVIHFYIRIETTGFANGYFLLGRLFDQFNLLEDNL